MLIGAHCQFLLAFSPVPASFPSSILPPSFVQFRMSSYPSVSSFPVILSHHIFPSGLPLFTPARTWPVRGVGDQLPALLWEANKSVYRSCRYKVAMSPVSFLTYFLPFHESNRTGFCSSFLDQDLTVDC